MDVYTQGQQGSDCLTTPNSWSSPASTPHACVTIAGHETEPTYVNADGCGLVEACYEAYGGSRASLPSAASGSLHGIAWVFCLCKA